MPLLLRLAIMILFALSLPRLFVLCFIFYFSYRPLRWIKLCIKKLLLCGCCTGHCWFIFFTANCGFYENWLQLAERGICGDVVPATTAAVAASVSRQRAPSVQCSWQRAVMTTAPDAFSISSSAYVISPTRLRHIVYRLIFTGYFQIYRCR